MLGRGDAHRFTCKVEEEPWREGPNSSRNEMDASRSVLARADRRAGEALGNPAFAGRRHN
jgi:hypothetical protein